MRTKKVADNKENLQKFSSTNSVLSSAQHARKEPAENEKTYQQSKKRLYTWSGTQTETAKDEQ
jgi:uncharacterized membrane protein YjjP (DUF1212 family)